MKNLLLPMAFLLTLSAHGVEKISLVGIWASECLQRGDGNSAIYVLSVEADSSSSFYQNNFSTKDCAGDPSKYTWQSQLSQVEVELGAKTPVTLNLLGTTVSISESEIKKMQESGAHLNGLDVPNQDLVAGKAYPSNPSPSWPQVTKDLLQVSRDGSGALILFTGKRDDALTGQAYLDQFSTTPTEVDETMPLMKIEK